MTIAHMLLVFTAFVASFASGLFAGIWVGQLGAGVDRLNHYRVIAILLAVIAGALFSHLKGGAS